jgi:hypothetical protein
MFVLLLSLAQAAPACVADDICDPTDSPCLIDSDWEIGDGCALDFGAREVRVVSNGRLDAGTGSVEVYAHALSVDSGELRGRDGGSMALWVTDDFILDGVADFHTDLSPGHVEVHAAFIWVMGRIELAGRQVETDGGSLLLDSATSIFVDAAIDAHGGRDAGGGSVSLLARGTIDVTVGIDASGGAFDGGLVELRAQGPLRLGGTPTTVSGGGEDGAGGTILLVGGGLVDVDAALRADGSAGGDGGYGGTLFVRSRRSTLRIAGTAHARGGGSDGDGGAITLLARDDLQMSSTVDASGQGTGSGGGEVVLSAGGTVSVRRPITAGGGTFGGGSVALYGRSRVEVLDDVAVDGGGGDGDGGDIIVKGMVVWVDRATLHAQGASAGFGGSILLEACELDLSATAVVDTNDDGGTNELIAHGSMEIAGDVLAGGGNTFLWRDVAPVVEASARVIPAAVVTEDAALAVCPG